jgi:Uma2 family endonuclease
MASLPDLEPRPISVADYHRMIDAGILDEDEKVELLEGVISTMSPQKDPHIHAILTLNELAITRLGGHYQVRPQVPLTVGDMSEPEPDLAIAVRGPGAARGKAATALLVIEVSGASSLRRDRGVKARIYARAGIPEYWIVNLDERLVEIHRDPDPAAETYRTLQRVASGGDLRSSAVPELSVPVAELFA